MSLHAELDAVFEADRALSAAEQRLFGGKDKGAIASALAERVDEERKKGGEQSGARLMRLADLCAQAPSAVTIDALIRILDCPEPKVRSAAGEALLDLGIDRFRDLRAAIERALGQADLGPALEELPFLLAELGDPPSTELIARFLDQSSAEVVAAAIEALSAVGDPSAIPRLRKLEGDAREVVLEEEGVGQLRMTIGELSQDAIGELTAAAPGP